MKKRNISCILVISLLLLLSGCKDKDTHNKFNTDEKQQNIINESYLTDIENCSNIEKSAKLLDALNESSNVMISMTSLNMALDIILNGSVGKTKDGIENFIGMTTEEANEYSKLFLADSEKDSSLDITNSIWINNNGYNLNKGFVNSMQQNFNAITNLIEFNEKGKEEINTFIAKNTDNLIPKMLEEIDTEATNYIINTVLFDKEWEVPFKKNLISEEKFTCIDGTKESIRMMNGETTLYLKNENATGFIKNYRHKKYSFIGILPNDKGKFVLSDLDIKSLLESETSDYDVLIGLPKFTYNTSVNLSNVLCETSLKEMFSPLNNEITNIIIKDNIAVPLHVSNIIQNTRIENSESGTKATAVTSVTFETTSAMKEKRKTKEVILNRPFAFIIMDNTTKEPIFMGIVQNPNES